MRRCGDLVLSEGKYLEGYAAHPYPPFRHSHTRAASRHLVRYSGFRLDFDL